VSSVALLPALALVFGSAGAPVILIEPWTAAWALPPFLLVTAVAWRLGLARAMLGLSAASFFLAGLVLGTDARNRALQTPVRMVLDQAFGGFIVESPGPEGYHEPIPARVRLTEDAAVRDGYVSLRGRVTAVFIRGEWKTVGGGVGLSVGGAELHERMTDWRAGRTIEAPVVFRRAARYFNDGVPDFERDLALGGTTLFGSIKSGLLVEVTSRGTRGEEAWAHVRVRVRRASERWIARHDPLSGAIVTAILIGDRSGLPNEIRERLQAAGTYHVIAISGGNIAILAGLVVCALWLLGIQGRAAALVTIAVLLTYAQIVTTEASVWRATLMATLYFAARALDHRTSPSHALAVTAAAMVAMQPLDVRDPGFILSFGATVALLEGARRSRVRVSGRGPRAWIVASLSASAAVEIGLLPVTAYLFSRVTLAGLVLNLLAVPAMTVVQAAGMVVAILDPLAAVAAPAGWLAHGGAWLLVNSARLVEIAPWLTARVPAPPVWLVAVYYVSLAAAGSRHPSLRSIGTPLVAAAALLIAGVHPAGPTRRVSDTNVLRITVFDVGQAEAILIEPPGSDALLVDAGGSPFGRGGFDVGSRVVVPAVWARGVRSLKALLITHGHPDHAGGAYAVIRDLLPVGVWHGVPVPGDAEAADVLRYAIQRRRHVVQRLAGTEWQVGPVRMRVLHPQEPDWERQRVRNDDSVVLEVAYGNVVALLTGDISAEVERAILPNLTPAPFRVLKVPHHGSRGSSSRELLESWRPHVALISAGRGNTFGHPAPEVLRRLEAVGAHVLRTDLHGQITIETDGQDVRVRTWLPTASAVEVSRVVASGTLY
jgi:competence protein ComEC